MKFQLSHVIGYLKELEQLGKKHTKILEHVETVQDDDREKDRDMERRLGHVEVELKALTTLISKIPNQTRDKLAEVAEPIITEAQNLKEAINDKEIVEVKHPIKKSRWGKFKNWVRRGWE